MMICTYAVVGLIFILVGLALQHTMGNFTKDASELKSAITFSAVSFFLYTIGLGLGTEALAQYFHHEPIFINTCTLAISFMLWWAVSTFCFFSPRENLDNKKDSAGNINVLPPRLPRI